MSTSSGRRFPLVATTAAARFARASSIDCFAPAAIRATTIPSRSNVTSAVLVCCIHAPSTAYTSPTDGQREFPEECAVVHDLLRDYRGKRENCENGWLAIERSNAKI